MPNHVDMQISQQLPEIAAEISKLLDTASGGQHMAFSLLVWNSTSGSRMSYIANCSCAEVKEALKEILEKWDVPGADIPSHEFH